MKHALATIAVQVVRLPVKLPKIFLGLLAWQGMSGMVSQQAGFSGHPLPMSQLFVSGEALSRLVKGGFVSKDVEIMWDAIKDVNDAHTWLKHAHPDHKSSAAVSKIKDFMSVLETIDDPTSFYESLMMHDLIDTAQERLAELIMKLAPHKRAHADYIGQKNAEKEVKRLRGLLADDYSSVKDLKDTLQDQEDFVRGIPGRIQQERERIDKASRVHEVLEQKLMDVDPGAYSVIANYESQQQQVLDIIDTARQNIEVLQEDEREMKKTLRELGPQFRQRIKDFEKNIEKIKARIDQLTSCRSASCSF